MKSKKFLLSVAAAALCAAGLVYPATSHAQQTEVGSIAYLPTPSVYDIEPAAGGDAQPAVDKDRRRWARFFEYQHRENCQGYVDPPEGWVFHRCTLVPVPPPVQVTYMTEIEPAAGPPTYDMRAHTVYFDWDRDTIRESEKPKISAAAQDIMQSRPSVVTIDGHADASGPNDYNMGLSSRRAQSVADALTSQGVSRDIISQAYHGEEDLAVDTVDGVRLEANRRTSIMFTPTQPPAGTFQGPGM